MYSEPLKEVRQVNEDGPSPNPAVVGFITKVLTFTHEEARKDKGLPPNASVRNAAIRKTHD
jgi:hypothetical protein